MLVLSRKPGEKIEIGNGITLSVVRISGNTVRLGIEAPQDVRVRRSELPDHAQFETREVLVEMPEPRAAR